MGVVFAALVPISSIAWHDWLWTVHALAACAFIAYIPFHRMIHSFATPVGRLVNSRSGLLAAKKAKSLAGIIRRRGVG